MREMEEDGPRNPKWPSNSGRNSGRNRTPGREVLWDAFEREDEAGEPEPEPGDFWAEPEEESPWNVD